MTLVATSAALRLGHRQYDPTLFAPRHARSWVNDLLDGWGWEGARATVALLTSELVRTLSDKHRQPSAYRLS